MFNIDDNLIPTTGRIAKLTGHGFNSVDYAVRKLKLGKRRAGQVRTFSDEEARQIAKECDRIYARRIQPGEAMA